MAHQSLLLPLAVEPATLELLAPATPVLPVATPELLADPAPELLLPLPPRPPTCLHERLRLLL